MGEDLWERDPVAGIVGQHEEDEVHTFRGESVGKSWWFLPLVQQLLQCALVTEWQLSHDHGVQYDTQTPHVRQFPVVAVSAEEFRRSVGVAARDGVEVLADLPPSAAEVGHLEPQFVVQEDVLQLQIAVHQVHTVELCHGKQQVPEELPGVVLAQRSFAVDELSQVSVGTVLHDLEDAVPVKDRFVEADYVVVSQPLSSQRFPDDLLVQHHVAP